MAETTADVRRDIEMTRERMSHTIAELERKLNVSQVVKDHPWPAIGLALGAGFLLSGSGADMKAASAAASGVAATKGASSRLAPLLDDVVARMLNGITEVLYERADDLVDELKRALGAPPDRGSSRQQFAQSQQRQQQNDFSSHAGEHGDTRQQDAGTRPGGLDFQRGDGPAHRPQQQHPPNQPHQQTGHHGTDPGQGYGHQPRSS